MRRPAIWIALAILSIALAAAVWLPAGCVSGDSDSAPFRQGVEYLLGLQKADGKWPERATTGTGFPNVFYLTYAMYRDYFPLLALSQV